MLDTARAALPVFDNITVCGGLAKPSFTCPNVRLVGVTLALARRAPVPVMPTVCGLPPALSVMVSDAVREPTADGVNVTPIEQLPPAATPLEQLFVCAKSPAFVPLKAMPETLRAALPMFESVTVCAALVEPRFC
jgi:hypothetical protein